jgi:hypothetical protein
MDLLMWHHVILHHVTRHVVRHHMAIITALLHHRVLAAAV